MTAKHPAKTSRPMESQQPKRASQLENALDALGRGLQVFPCLPKSKIPATAHGSKERTNNETQIRKWWGGNSSYNVGCTAGTVLDCDKGLKSREEALVWARLNALPETLVIRTGRRDGNYGCQFHFSGQAAHSGHFEKNGVSGEVRIGNLYGLFAGSIHPISGERYEIVVDVPVVPWPESVHLGNARREPRASAHLASEEIVTNAYAAQQTFQRLLNEARHAKPGGRNFASHALAWFGARAYLAGVLLKETEDGGFVQQTEREIKDSIHHAVFPLYGPNERHVEKMLRDSWNYGIRAGRLPLDVYSADLDQLFKVVDFQDERIHRLLDGVTTDFPSAIAARDYFVGLLEKADFDHEGKNRVVRYSQLDDRVAAQILAELKVAKFLTEGKDDGK